ncbi:efflux RND transporter periplasmic adaptor subunit [Chitinophaga sp. SYP-B3965]|uniref:efflux RND transporter periplasmic adaptor subunit n=1 Tax=Chitinophaga sp. SYP-B3965 TaxID=2663120 RepID=UPI001299FB92|nr:efflux RND transporter periplasmic adaptor subunit [Chitinophaga sp. SYP-B3965]MRG48669.1 efflux RND transporter periplasmic adaptor subunit [Chitinophaga sp. SYP-B3965]
MTKRYFVLPLITVILAACGGGGGNKTEELQKLKQEKSALDAKITALEKELKAGDSSVKMKTVTIAAISDTTFEHYIDIQGSVDAKENVNASAQVPGVIRAIFVREGQAVSKGQALAQVDDLVLRSGIAELQTQIDLAEIMYQKQANLWKQQIGSEVQYLNAKAAKDNLERKMSTLKDQLAQTRITAPINGTVDQVIAKVGDNIAPGTPSFRIVNSNNLRVIANIAESFAGKVKTGDEVLLTFPDINKEQRTRIGFASKTIDPVSRTIRVEIPLNGSADLHPNMIAQLRIIDYKAKDAIVVPVSVIQYSMGKPYVLTVKGSGDKLQAVRNNIEIGRTYNDRAEIKSGLQIGDRIITSGFQGVNDNDLVKL